MRNQRMLRVYERIEKRAKYYINVLLNFYRKTGGKVLKEILEKCQNVSIFET